MSEHVFDGQLFAWDEDAPDSWVFVAVPAEVSDHVACGCLASRRRWRCRRGARLPGTTRPRPWGCCASTVSWR